ncbi:MAG: hypothetical protein K6V97_11315 [Actinomycetia bacterium]|nr:hypothetical protein [Actinomycetes bacterium]
MSADVERAASLRPGTRLVSIHGERAHDEQDILRETGPGAVGVITQALRTQDGRPYYAVAFPGGVSVFLDPEEIADPTAYRVLDGSEDGMSAAPARAAQTWVAVCVVDGVVEQAANGPWVEAVARAHARDTGHRVVVGYEVAAAGAAPETGGDPA